MLILLAGIEPLQNIVALTLPADISVTFAPTHFLFRDAGQHSVVLSIVPELPEKWTTSTGIG